MQTEEIKALKAQLARTRNWQREGRNWKMLLLSTTSKSTYCIAFNDKIMKRALAGCSQCTIWNHICKIMVADTVSLAGEILSMSRKESNWSRTEGGPWMQDCCILHQKQNDIDMFTRATYGLRVKPDL
jgi:hypothetical protein